MPMKRFGVCLAAAALFSASAAAQPRSPLDILNSAPDEDWVEIPRENLLVMDLPSGRIIIEMRPDLAPAHVERIKTLTKQGFYDGVVFHRVIDGFMAQGGDPTATGQGGSDLPDLPGEFLRVGGVLNEHIIGRDDDAAQIGYLGTVPVGTQPPTLPRFLAEDTYALWGLHCPGVMSMARTNDPNSANSQFFLMFGNSRSGLDRTYTVWGNIVSGFSNARRINRGEPPARPTPIVRMRMMEDLPAEEQGVFTHLRTDSAAFREVLVTTRRMTDDNYVEDMCGIDVPVRINGEYTQ